jgi:ketosteroid isomerase-like protein
MSHEAERNEIVALEREALNRWGKGDPAGFLELYGKEVTYFDPATEFRIDGQQAMVDYYRPWTGLIQIMRFDMVNPQVTIDGNMALLTYNLINYIEGEDGVETVGSRWNSSTVFRKEDGAWRSIHSHWSFTRHPALQKLTVESSEQSAAQ